MRTAEAYPAFKDGFIVIDDRDAPSLRNAIASRIYKLRRHAVNARERACYMLNVEAMEHIKIVPVDGPNDVFKVDYIDASDVIVRMDGTIRMRATAAV